MKNIRALAVLNAVAFGVQLFISWLVQARMLNPLTVAEVSDKYPSLFTPAGVTFTIWGLIYLSLAAFCIYHLVMAWRKPAGHQANKDIEQMDAWFVMNNLATSFWLIAWTNEELSLSVIFIAIQLLSLIIINRRLGIYDTRRSTASSWLTQFPLSIYFGWITIAAIANISSYLNTTAWDGWGLDPIDWTNILIGVAVFITLLVMVIRRNVFYGLVVIWGLYGIILKREAADGVLYFHILRTAWIGISLLALVAVLRLIKNRVQVRHEQHFPMAQHPLK